ncbi:LOW QUALITY PROTEIN: CWF19-like protein 2 [Diaphorina citri]|uniref:LOW QUALITY PROTEIN: CWF19-like protein 2 n=1 Tax=Diaphorina citri TaxID=121845 RepID=A0A3Q0JBY6_DIACI|nr:LOW QUALITY PROTEIN: CWF19-like protein 2 [Diaphorina citri]
MLENTSKIIQLILWNCFLSTFHFQIYYPNKAQQPASNSSTNESTSKNSRNFQKPCSGDEDDRRYSSNQKDKYSKSDIKNDKRFQKPCSDSDDERYSSHRKDKYSKSEHKNDKRFQKPCSDSDDERYSSHRKDKYSKSEHKNDKRFQKPCSDSDDERYSSHRKDKYSKSEHKSDRRFQKPSSDSDDERYSSHQKDKYSKSEHKSDRRFQKPCSDSDDERYSSHRKDKYSKSEHESDRRFQKPSSDDERYSSHRKDKYSKSEHKNDKKFQKPCSDSDDERYSSNQKGKYGKSDEHKSDKRFQKPCSDSDDERYSSHRKDKHTKKDDSEQCKASSYKSKRNSRNDEEEHSKNGSSSSTPAQTSQVTHDDVNKLAAKLIKAEMMGNTALVAKLKLKLEAAAKREDSEQCKPSGDKSKRNSRNDEEEHSKNGSSSSTPAQTSQVTHDDVNKLAAKLIKAEMMGNTALVAKLKLKLEAAKSQEVKPSRKPRDEVRQEHRVVVISEHSMKDKRKMELLERKKLAFLGDNEDRWVSEGKTFANIGDEYEETPDAPRRKKPKSNTSTGANALQQAKRTADMLNSCAYCRSSEAGKHRPILIDQVSEHVYLALPPHEPLVPHHCMIVTQQHTPCLRQTERNVYDSIRSVCEKLVARFSRARKTCVFYEMVSSMKWNHCVVHCVPLDDSTGEMAPMYFQKSLQDLESDSRNNRTLIKIERNKLCSSIPAELEYFYVNFDWGKGFAHLIENKMSRTFAEEIIGGMLDLDSSKWRKPAPLQSHHST